MDRASACTTVTGRPANRPCRWRARAGCSSTAMTRAPRSTSSAVSAPWPAPISSTSSPGRTAASATIRAAHSSVSGCQPHARRDRTKADMADHVQEEDHGPTVGGQLHRPQRIFGGEVTITRVGDVDPTAAPEQTNLVINAQLIGGDITLRASDRQDTSTEPQTRIELSLIGTDDARMRALFDGLADGGTVRAKLEKQFWGDVFGAVTDKYGIGWQINIGTAGA